MKCLGEDGEELEHCCGSVSSHSDMGLGGMALTNKARYTFKSSNLPLKDRNVYLCTKKTCIRDPIIKFANLLQHCC